jgi:xanthine/CO dehydrogenase XdhC/CoxF family maturation factor
MLLASDGRRAGTISGGCLEGEVARKAFWLTENGPVVRRYSTRVEDGDVPFGMGCGGVVHVLLERSATAHALLERLSEAFEQRLPMAVATVIQGIGIGERGYFPASASELANSDHDGRLSELAKQAFEEQRSFSTSLYSEDREAPNAWAEWVPARTGLFVFGAGDDAIPLVRVARQLGWYVAVADGRTNLVNRARFPEAHKLYSLARERFEDGIFRPTDAAVLMTHSLEQDGEGLRILLSEDLGYVGVLGPRRRTAELLFTIAQETISVEDEAAQQAVEWLGQIHAPIGLDLGGDTPAEIAVSIIAEVQQTRYRTTGRALREISAYKKDRLILSTPVI